MFSLVSIIIPIYNTQNYLPRCLESIINQSYKNLEIILVNDGSTDNSLEICESYAKKDSRMSIMNKENGGSSSARNLGLDICRGDYISFIDSDDWVEEDFIEALLEGIKKENVGISIIGHKKIDKEDFSDTNDIDNIPKTVLTSSEAINLYMNNKLGTTSVCNKLFASNLFDKIRFPEGVYYEDEYILLSLFFKSQKIYVNNQVKYYYLQRKGSRINSNYNWEKYYSLVFLLNNQKKLIEKKMSAIKNLFYMKACFSIAERIKYTPKNTDLYKLNLSLFNFYYGLYTEKKPLKMLILKLKVNYPIVYKFAISKYRILNKKHK
ncbi:glycosyltransferase family 2 protein [Francisella salimarina]|uniref:Glycosyltransferase family 2 protein n=1 Tax=Francisella salimarina TaxID=2599927 RepID=A0AAJ4NND5_9GAMM|nr:glycosyltransferase family 2 protein [Francisella salimarina]QWU98701.1 glycosyltransferase family 2 protein [Francisella salimarina]